MERTRILEILNDWNFWSKNQPSGIERKEYVKVLLKALRTTDSILTVTGVRRAGKSFILKQIAKSLIESGVRKEDILIVNFEDERFLGRDLKLLREIYEVYLDELKPEKRILLLDEVQTVDEWERFVRGIHERKEAKVVVSGSSSKLMSEELATLLAGRGINFSIYPLSFREFLKFRNIEIRNNLDLVSKKSRLKELLKEYLEFGGFPEVVLSEEKPRLLLSYFDTIVVKDIIDRFKIREREKLRRLAKFYLTNISSPVTYHKISDFLNLPVKTVERFSRYVEIANLMYFVKKFSFSVKEQEKSPRKVYSIDVGLSNVVGFKFTEDLGKVMENVVAIELLRRKCFNPFLEVYYWKDFAGREVDFVVKEKREVKELIQVCYEVGRYEVRERETKALLKAGKELKCGNLLIVTGDFEGEEKVKGRKIKFIPLWKWLLV